MTEKIDNATYSAGSAPAVNEDQKPAALGIEDIENAVNVIDYACEQGAFKGWNVIEQVNGVRNRLALFVKSVKPVKETEEAPASSSPKTEVAV